MSNPPPPSKKPRIDDEDHHQSDEEEDGDDGDDDEEALAALVEHRAREVEQLKRQLHRATRLLRLSQSRLHRIRSRKLPDHKVPAFTPASKRSTPAPAPAEKREHKDLIPFVRKSPSPRLLKFQPSVIFPSRHRRKLRCLELNPVNERLFATSALEGLVGIWQIQGGGSGAAPLGTAVDCSSPGQRRWPEAIAWHPAGDRLFSAYTADNADAQVSVFDMNAKGQSRVAFLQPKPHHRGIINSITFLPAGAAFATGGSDHAVVVWTESEQSWKPKALHRNLHSAAVTGVAGLLHRPVLVSVGADKRIVGYNLGTGRAEYKHQVEHKCMSVVPNPADTNLFMVQTGSPEKQLRLLDIRLRQTEIHAFGWRQESSESQSALINQDWSPDGWYVSSGTADPAIHVFDIRFNSPAPCQTAKAHQKRVFKAAWHRSLPLLISISSDLNIGLHRINAAS